MPILTAIPPPTPTFTPRPTSVPTPTPVPLHGQALLDKAKGFPRAVLFRSGVEQAARRNDTVAQVISIAERYDMVIAKALNEEVPGLLATAPYLRAIKARYPDKIVLDHFLFEGRNPLTSQPSVFPGHWLLLNGTILSADITRSDSVLQVANSSVLREGEAVQLTALDASGKSDYTRVEQVRIISISTGRATVERGAYGSQPLDFQRNQTRVAAHAWTEYSNQVWKYNFCLEGPKDAQGRRLIEALAQNLAEYLRPGGILEGLDGYQFDVARFSISSKNQGERRLDCDNDGAPDGAYINGVNSYGLGAVTFTRALRSLVGDDMFLISEATGASADRDIAYANGIENESFPDLHRWDDFSAAYERYQYWLQKARQPRLSYLQLKETTEAFTRCAAQDKGTNWKYRLAIGAALLGDGFFAYLPTNPEAEVDCSFQDPVTRYTYAELDEFKAGKDNRWNYLGKPIEEPRRLDMIGGATSLLPNGNFEIDLKGVELAVLGGSQAMVTRDESQAGTGIASLRVSITRLDPDPGDNKVRLEFPKFGVQKGKEYTLRLRVRADPKYRLIDPTFAEVPRSVLTVIRVAGMPPLSQDIMADGSWRQYSLTFVAPADDPAASLAFFLGKEGGDVWLDDVHLFQGTGNIFVRRFENGVVLVNASTQLVSFDAQTLFPGMALRRISGTQDPTINSGAPVGPRIAVAGRDALILLTSVGN